MLWICGRLALLLAVPLILTSASFAADTLKLYVSPQGNDASDGLSATKTATSGPFLTPERARDEVRKLRAAGAFPTRGLIIEFQPGIYEFSKPLELTELDSGTAACPITWRSRPGTEVRFVGGKVVTGWKPVSDQPTLDRLDPAARGKVFVVALAPLGIADYGQPSGGCPGIGHSRDVQRYDRRGQRIENRHVVGALQRRRMGSYSAHVLRRRRKVHV